ncbi:uncharacterized protein EV420DRAFT_1764365 [Desarmillaria tabescens]|uniref:DUF6535 domain-containing protein n=1 Tax=Armillaria tabescens TaxID=1929756 RepID=A0AA39KBU9_ARMTA|nr:uncharacterized protein EV420DRAFT_1764365 [Desarmillaria tabescens]KAK0458230.1 hypothetical protein EV420DRAFT_1764365 [Desarmillaria tabescens]
MPETNENCVETPPNQSSAAGNHVSSTANPEDPNAQRNPPSGTFFGMRKNQPSLWGVGATPRDYKARYPLDPYGQEMSQWRDTIDVLLVFAGLFSAVLTTFVVQTSQNMQPDYNEASARLLFEILKVTMSNGSQSSIPSSPTAFLSPSPSNEWMNSLWFVSLTFSLVTALVAILVKQWLHQYVAVVSGSCERDCARIRHLRYAGLQKWQVPMIIGLLPVPLHVSLAFFFAGLVVFLFSLGMKVAWLVSVIGAATYIAYVVALILPFVYPYCPYKVLLTLYIHQLYQFIIPLIPRITLMRCHSHTPSPFLPFRRHYNLRLLISITRINLRLIMHWITGITPNIILQRRKHPLSLKEIEHDHVQKCAAKVDVQSLLWLHSSTSNASVHQSVLQACSGMTSATLKCLPEGWRSAFVVSLRQQIKHIGAPSPDAERELELRYRAYLLLHYSDFSPDRDRMADRCSNEQLKMILYSVTDSERPLTILLRILQGPKRSSLALHSVVWKTLVKHAISFPPRPGRDVLELELELMKILVGPLITSESGDVTTIDKPTDEMREYILDKLWFSWDYDCSKIRDNADSVHLRTMLQLIPQIQQRLCDSAHTSDRKQVIETSLIIIECMCTNFLSNPFDSAPVIPFFNTLCSLLSSETFATVGDLETLAHKIFMTLEKLAWEMLLILNGYWGESASNIRVYSVAYQCYLRSLADGGERSENDAMLPILKGLLPSSSVDMSSNFPMHNTDSHGTLTPSNLPHWKALFLTNTFFSVVLLLIDEHNENVLYDWA